MRENATGAGEQSDPGFLPLAYGIELPVEPLGHPDSPVREVFMMQLRRGLLTVSDVDLMALAEDALEGEKKAEGLLGSARAEMGGEDGSQDEWRRDSAP